MKKENRFLIPTPKFFRKVRNVGLGLAAAGGAILKASSALPSPVIAVSGYLIAIGTAMAIVAQSVTADRK